VNTKRKNEEKDKNKSSVNRTAFYDRQKKFICHIEICWL